MAATDTIARAVGLIGTLEPDVVISEHVLPDGTPERLLDLMREAGATGALVVHASFVRASDRTDLEHAGAFDVVLKTPDMQQLALTVRAAVGHGVGQALQPVASIDGDSGSPGERMRPVLAIAVPILALLLAVFLPELIENVAGAGSAGAAAALIGGMSALALLALGLPLLRQTRATGRARNEAATLRAEADQYRQFLAAAAHDLRTPATVVSGFSEALLNNYDAFDDTQRLDMLERIHRSGRRLAGLLDDLLTSAMSDMGQLRLVAQDEDLAKIVTAAVAQSRLAGSDEVDLVDLGQRVRTDARALTRVLANLLDNAAKYGRPPVRVEAERIPGRVRVRVIDQGDGVDRDFRTILFSAFSQDCDDALQREGGVGLGLSVVSVLSAQMGIAVRYVVKEGGAVFELDIPAGSDDPQARHHGEAVRAAVQNSEEVSG